MCLPELDAIDSFVSEDLRRAAHTRLVLSPVADLVHHTMIEPIVGLGWEGGLGTPTIPDHVRTLAPLLSLWT